MPVRVMLRVFVGVSCIASIAAAAGIDLSIPKTLYAGIPVGTVTADVDGDGREDFIVPAASGLDFGAEGFAVYRNLGNRTLAPRRFYGVSGYGEGLRILPLRDLNRDGRPDLLAEVRSSPPQLVIALNLGDGTFGAPLLRSLNYHVRDVAAGDLNGDGWLDLAVSTSAYFAGPLAIVTLFNGGGHFGSPLVFAWPGMTDSPVALADLNLDGWLDAVTVGLYFPNQGNGLMGIPLPIGGEAATNLPHAAMASGYSMAVVDLNHDAAMDVVVGAAGGAVSVALNRGGMGFDRTVYSAECAVPLFVGDLDADHNPDIAVAGAGSCTILANNGAGGFSSTVYAGAGGDGNLLVRDLDGDDRLDLLVTGGAWLTPLLNQGAQNFLMGDSFGPFLRPWNGVFVDVDDDQTMELLATATGGSGVLELRSRAGGGGAAPRRAINGFPDGGFAAGDFDRDGVADVLTPGAAFVRGAVGGRFMPPAQLSWDDHYGTSQATAAGDFDADGWPDAAFARANGVSVVLNGGTGSLLGPVSTYATFASPSAVVVGDFDGDGDQDLVCNGWGSYLVLLWNDGDGQFGAPVYVNLFGGTPLAGVAADFNGDQVLDLAMAMEGAKDLVLLSHGDGTFDQLPLGLAGYSSAIAAADLDSDGDMDVMAANASGLVAYCNDRGGFFHVSWSTNFDVKPLAIAVGDFDAARGPDIIAFGTNSHSLLNQVFLFANRGDATFEPADALTAPNRVTGCAVYDFTGDGRLDVLAGGQLYENHSGATTPVLIQDLRAARVPAGVLLNWRLAMNLLGRVREVAVQRSESPAGPYASRGPGALAPQPAMSFLDPEVAAGATLWYRLHVGFTDGTQTASEPIEIPMLQDGSGTAIRSVGRRTPDGEIEIRYHLGAAAPQVDLGIYDVRGHRVWSVTHAGNEFTDYVQRWDGHREPGAPVARGVYFARLTAGGLAASKKFSLMK